MRPLPFHEARRLLMALGEKQARFLELFYPGLIAAVQALGAGEFEEGSLRLAPAGDGLRSVESGCTYPFGRYLVDIRFRLQRRPGSAPWALSDPVRLADWVPTYYRLHYGCPKADPDTIFRFDRDASGPHVHIRPNPKEHVLALDAHPNTTDMDPRAFVSMVAEFRTTNTYPIRRK